MDIIFYLHASIAVVAMGFAMLTPHAIHALLCAVVSLLCLAISLYALSAPLAAALEVIIYAGAIMVLFVFAIMLLQVPVSLAKKEKDNAAKRRVTLAFIVFAVFWAELLFVLQTGFSDMKSQSPTINDIAKALFGSYGFLLEVVSFVLLAGLTTAVFVGRTLAFGEES